jgi:aspartate/methionine/tyrosine aminotransferase
MDFAKLYSERTHGMKASEIRELLKLTEKPNIISFAGGLPNPSTFPVKEVEEATHRVLRDHAKSALQYSTTEGVTILREAVAEHLRADGMDVHPDNVLITNGSQQGLDLLGRVFLDKGDTVIVANPTYLGALQSFNYFGAKYATADSDQDGIIPESVEATLADLKKKGVRPKFLYVVSTFANPTGTTISGPRRKRLLELAHEHDLLIVEDDPYGKLRFDGSAIPSIHSMDKGEGRVVYLGTFSKILVPGFRLAWSVAPSDVTRKMVISKQSVDLCTNARASTSAPTPSPSSSPPTSWRAASSTSTCRKSSASTAASATSCSRRWTSTSPRRTPPGPRARAASSPGPRCPSTSTPSRCSRRPSRRTSPTSPASRSTPTPRKGSTRCASTSATPPTRR